MTLLGLVESDDDIQLLNHVWQTGDMLPYLGSTDILAGGWLVCDGRLVDTTIPLGILLNGVFGSSASGPRAPAPYGGSGTGYNLPNCCDRFVQGAGNAVAYQLGHSGGALAHTHGVGTLALNAHSHPSAYSLGNHGHSINPGDGGHTHSQTLYAVPIMGKNDNGVEDIADWDHTNGANPGYSGGIYGASASIGGSVANASPGIGGTSGSADPPYQRLNWIIHV